MNHDLSTWWKTVSLSERHPLLPALAFPQLRGHATKGNLAMAKSIDSITEIIRDTKHPFRKADDRPVKAQKHRYERRKIKEYIKLSNWGEDS